jgi:hypothetical protein
MRLDSTTRINGDGFQMRDVYQISLPRLQEQPSMGGVRNAAGAGDVAAS